MSSTAFRAALLALTLAGCAAADAGSDGGGTGGNGCTAGGTCSTGNPGACAMGHITCSNNQSSCEPDVTEQACYGADPATQNKGICHGGMQSCIGTLGACMGNTLPAAGEDCFNQLDDDCNGKVNDGCPRSFMIGAPDPLVARGGSGGGAVSSLCPDGAIMTGMQVTLSAIGVSPGYVISVQPSCATPSLVRDDVAKTYSLALTPVAAPAPMAGTDAARTGSSWISCGSTSAVANGTQGSVISGDRTVIESAGANCATLALALDAQNQLSLTLTHDAADSGVASVQQNGTVWNDSCAAGEVLIGFQGHTGAQMDQLQGVCAPLIVTYF